MPGLDIIALAATAIALLVCLVVLSRVAKAAGAKGAIGDRSPELEAERGRLIAELRDEGQRRVAAEVRAEKLPHLESELVRREQLLQALQLEHTQVRAQLEAEVARVQHERELREALDEKFQALSAAALQKNNEQFLQQAKMLFESERKGHKAEHDKREQVFQQFGKTIGDTLDSVHKQLTEVEKNRLTTQAAAMERMQAIEKATTMLGTALRAPKARGSWGEQLLRQTVEAAGMVENIHFETEHSVNTDDGRLRPDMIIRMSGGRTVVVDAKTPRDSYLAAVEAEDDVTREARLAEHALRIREHVKALAKKEYSAQFERAPQFVVLFLPGEDLLSAALTTDPALWDFAIRQRVLLATPTNLIGTLWAVSEGWREQQLAENAKAISEVGAALYKAVVQVGTHWGEVGRHLDRAVEGYNKSVGSLERNFLPKGRALTKLGVANDKEVPELAPVEVSARRFVADELADIDEIEDVEVIEAPPLTIVAGHLVDG